MQIIDLYWDFELYFLSKYLKIEMVGSLWFLGIKTIILRYCGSLPTHYHKDQNYIIIIVIII